MDYEDENEKEGLEASESEDDTEDDDEKGPFVIEEEGYDPTLTMGANLADKLTDDQRAKLGALVVEDTKKDLDSREAMVEEWAEWGKLYVGKPDQSALGARNKAPNMHTPGLTVAVDQYSARAEKYLLPPGRIAKPRGTGIEDGNRAWRTSQAANVVFEHRIKRFRRTVSTGIKQSAIFGTSALKTWQDNDRIAMAVVPAEDFIVSHTHSGALEDAERITHRLRLTRDQIRSRIKAGLFHEDGWDLDDDTPPLGSEEDDALATLREETDGTTPADGEPGPMIVYEQHRMLDLDGDGIGEPYVVTVHKESERVLRIVSRQVVNKKGAVETEHFFTELPFDYNPLGFYGLGLGAKAGGLNRLQNSIANIMLFASLRNTFPPKFASKKAFKSIGEREYDLDEWMEAEGFVEDLQKNLYIAPTVPPSPVLNNMYLEAGRQLNQAVSVTPVMQGLEQPHNQAATTTKVIQQESMEMFNGSFRRMLDALSELIGRVYQLIRLNMTDEEYVAILGQTGQPEQAAWEQAMAQYAELESMATQMAQTGQPLPPQLVQALMNRPPETWCTVADDFNDSVDLIPTADPNLTTEQERLAQSEAALNLVISGPEQPNPRAIWSAKRKRLEALRVPESDINELMPEPPAPEPPPNLGPQETLAALLTGNPPVVIQPGQPHQEIIATLKAFKVSPLYADILPAAKEAIDRHIQERVGALISEEAKRGQEQRAAGIGAPGGGGPMPPAPANGGGGMGGPPRGGMVPVGAGPASLGLPPAVGGGGAE